MKRSHGRHECELLRRFKRDACFVEDLSETLDPQDLPTTCESQCTSKKHLDTNSADKIKVIYIYIYVYIYIYIYIHTTFILFENFVCRCFLLVHWLSHVVDRSCGSSVSLKSSVKCTNFWQPRDPLIPSGSIYVPSVNSCSRFVTKTMVWATYIYCNHSFRLCAPRNSAEYPVRSLVEFHAVSDTTQTWYNKWNAIMKPTGINNCCTKIASTVARRIQDIGKNHEDRTFPTCSATAYIPCKDFIMFFVLSHTTHRRIQMNMVRKRVFQNITKIRWLF
jgi:hypothetical protein